MIARRIQAASRRQESSPAALFSGCGDFRAAEDGDGVFNVHDMLIAVSKLLGGSFTAEDGKYYFDRSGIALRDILWMLAKVG